MEPKETHYHFRWNIQEADIEKELDRQGLSSVSFVFVLKWLSSEIEKHKKNNSNLLKYLNHPDSPLPNLKTENEILTMCYFNYLEERGYLSRTDKYLYGMLLETV